eukprot:scaffold80583_cov72-Phaeocystis_antarctica.AAC.2
MPSTAASPQLSRSRLSSAGRVSVSVTLAPGSRRAKSSPGRPMPAPSSSTRGRLGSSGASPLRMKTAKAIAAGQIWWPTPASPRVSPANWVSSRVRSSPSAKRKVCAALVYVARGHSPSAVDTTEPRPRSFETVVGLCVVLWTSRAPASSE